MGTHSGINYNLQRYTEFTRKSTEYMEVPKKNLSLLSDTVAVLLTNGFIPQLVLYFEILIWKK